MALQLSEHFNVIMTFGIVLILGYISGKIANLCRLPKVTGYITAGVLLEPSLLGIIPQSFIDNSNVVSTFALCIITYAIGGSLRYKSIKRMGKTLILMTLFESLSTFFFVTVGLLLTIPVIKSYTGLSLDAAMYLPLALLAGALAAPTDPTPALAVKEEYKAEGPVMTTILGIGAFDDAFGIINFSLAIAVCGTLFGGSSISPVSAILQPLSDIVFSILLGIVTGCLLFFSAGKVRDKGVLVVLILGFLFTCFGVARALNLDELLSTMVLGCFMANSGKHEERFFTSIRSYFEEMVFVIFFVIAGAHLKLNVLVHCIWIVLVFVLFRVIGKVAGAVTGAVISGAEKNVKKYTALGLIPQGGIVVGLALLIKQQEQFSPVCILLLNLILGTTVFFEFLGPLSTEYALKRSGEINKGS